jgi:hypothetical protein
VKVYIAQVLCPQRHALVAQSGELPDEFIATPELAKVAADEIEQMVMERVRQCFTENLPEAWAKFGLPRMNPWCAICFALFETWKVEVGITPWSTLEEARPHLLREQAAQLVTRLLIDGSKAARN